MEGSQSVGHVLDGSAGNNKKTTGGSDTKGGRELCRGCLEDVARTGSHALQQEELGPPIVQLARSPTQPTKTVVASVNFSHQSKPGEGSVPVREASQEFLKELVLQMTGGSGSVAEEETPRRGRVVKESVSSRWKEGSPELWSRLERTPCWPVRPPVGTMMRRDQLTGGGAVTGVVV